MTPSILMVAGEASADQHGAKVLSKLRAVRSDVQVFGIGGESMREAGLTPIARAEDISVAGLTEVLFALPRIYRIMGQLTAAAAERRPAAAVLLDLPDFNLRLAARLRKLGIPVIYYISPQVWAWRPKRVEAIKRLVDKMLVILPFEEDFYRQHGVDAEFVGHPLVEDLPAPTAPNQARTASGLVPTSGPVVALLPGSRAKEVSRHLPLMLQGLAELRQSVPELRALLPVASTIERSQIDALVTASGESVTVLDGRASEALQAADVALVCSGTATLQTALLERPMVVVYRVSWLTFQILRRLVRVAHIALVNLIAGHKLVPELVQGEFTALNVAEELRRLLLDAEHHKKVKQQLHRMRDQLGSQGAADRVATVTASYLPAPSATDPSPGDRRP